MGQPRAGVWTARSNIEAGHMRPDALCAAHGSHVSLCTAGCLPACPAGLPSPWDQRGHGRPDAERHQAAPPHRRQVDHDLPGAAATGLGVLASAGVACAVSPSFCWAQSGEQRAPRQRHFHLPCTPPNTHLMPRLTVPQPTCTGPGST